MRIHFLIYGQNRSVTRASGWLVQFGNVEKNHERTFSVFTVKNVA